MTCDSSELTECPFTGRFAPSPTGRMHAGNIYAALVTWLLCRMSGGRVVLRIEDLDRERSRQEYVDCALRDFETLGLTWDEGPFYQRDRDDAYAEAYERLCATGAVYPCFCTRADLKAASAPHAQDKWVYPGTCRGLSAAQVQAKTGELKALGRPGPSWRLGVLAADSDFVQLEDLLQGPYEQHLETDCGDFVIRRADGAFAYHLAVVVDDAAQGINLVSRGIDLLPSSPQQRYLQQLLGLPEVQYVHFPLLVAPDGRRLAKRNKDAAMDQLFSAYGSAAGVLGHIAFVTGLVDIDQPLTCEDLLQVMNFARLKQSCEGKISIPWR
ncbi:MAG: tRNA glutamyl-Q(34) synthetase GluQRS [Coriobacteriia bacterium]|nr:tRNA glutamyl-Q(34) synthetase GluQRS [Coriobacteriia bacterium]